MKIKIKLSEIEPETLTAISKWVDAAVPKKWGQLSKIGFCTVDNDEKKKIFREPIGTEYFALFWGGEEIGEARVYDPELVNNCKAMREAIGRAVSFARHRKPKTKNKLKYQIYVDAEAREMLRALPVHSRLGAASEAVKAYLNRKEK